MRSLAVLLLATTSTIGAVNQRNGPTAPCDDFYDHICREWKSQNPIPEGRSSWSKIAKAQLQLAEEASEFLLTSPDLSHLEQQARILQGTCLLLVQRNDCPKPNRWCIERHEKLTYDTPFNAKQLSNSSGAAKEACLRYVSEHIPGAFESVYLRLRSKRFTIGDYVVERVFRDVKEATVDELRSTRWLDVATKETLVAKITDITLYGRSAFAERVAIANKCYSGLNLQWNNSLEQHGRQLGWVGDYAKCWPMQASNPLIRWPYSFFIPSLYVNAFYFSKDNSVALLPAYLHHEGVVNAWSRGRGLFGEALYGTLGYVLGHEVAHAIDNEGSLYNKDGKEGGWTPVSYKVFREKQKCLERSYSSIPVPGTNGTHFVDGTQTLGENMADLDGLKFASKALDIRRKRLGLPAASKLAFFKSYAELYCENVSTSEAKSLASSDTHSPSPVRVNEALRNNAEFAAAYGCKPGDPMNPAQKCYIWAD